MFKKLIAIGIIIFAAISCGENKHADLLVGKWEGAQWMANGQPKGNDASDVNFEFNADETYSASYGAQAEEGKYWLNGDKLYTTSDAEGQIQKMVIISRLTKDTLVMEMNRMGTPEQLVLVKR